MDNSKIKVGIIGFGRMGGKYLDKFLKNGRYEVAYICDVNKDDDKNDNQLGCAETSYKEQLRNVHDVFNY